MKKILTTLALLVAMTVMFAQAPQKFSYQGVVRDAAGNLVRNAPVGVRVSLLKTTAEGVAVYCETHRQSTNANGLLTLTIGDGTVVGGDMAAIDWADGPYFLKTETDITGGSNYTLVGAQQLLSVPYALYAGSTTNGFSGDYNDLSNKPEIPQVPTEVSAFTNDAGYISNKECDNLSYCQLVSQLTKLQNTVDSLKEKVQEGGGYGSDSLHSAKIEQLLLPLVNTLEIDTQTRFVKSEILFLGRSHITECGICYSTNSNPTLADEYVMSDNKSLGEYTCMMGYLLPNSTYYVGAYASNSEGVAYGAVIQFDTKETTKDSWPCAGTPQVTDYDENIYYTVQIGEQCWMRENLRTKHYADGSIITNVQNATSSYYYNEASANNASNGLIYTGNSVFYNSPIINDSIKIQGVCPNDWHMPSRAEWQQLSDYLVSNERFVCGKNGIAASMKVGKWVYSYNVSDCARDRNNYSGFSALPTSNYTATGLGDNTGAATTFWSGTYNSATGGMYAYSLSYQKADLSVAQPSLTYSHSVRCVKD